MDEAPTAEIPRLYPFPEVAKKTGIPLRILRERSWRAEFEHIHIGRERYLTQEQLDRLLQSLTVVPEEAAA